MSRRPRKRARTVRPPRGWEALEVVEPEPPPTAAQLDQSLRDDVTNRVRAGFRTRPEILKDALDAWRDQIARPECRKRVAAILTGAIPALQREQRTWPRTTDCDRLDRAFAELERRAILARQNYWCCGTCGAAAINDEMRKRRRAGKPVRGYTFFDEQDTDAAADGEGLCLSYGSDPWNNDAAVAIAKEVRKVLRSHGLRVQWNGSIDQRLIVNLKWRKRWNPVPQLARGGGIIPGFGGMIVEAPDTRSAQATVPTRLATIPEKTRIDDLTDTVLAVHFVRHVFG